MVRDPGYIKLWRSQLSHWIMQDPVALTVWTYLLLGAAYEPTTVKIVGEDILLRPGQMVRSRGFICRDLRLDEDRVRRALRKLEKDDMIRTQGFKWGTLITVTAWDHYQKGTEFAEKSTQPPAPLCTPLSGNQAPNQAPSLNGSQSDTCAENWQPSTQPPAPLNGDETPNETPTVKEYKKEEEEGTRKRVSQPPASQSPEWPSLETLRRLLPEAVAEYSPETWRAAYKRCCTHHDGQRWLIPGTQRPVYDPRQHFLATLERVSRRSQPGPQNTIALEKSIAQLREQVRLHVGNPINGDSPINHAERPAYKALKQRLAAAEAQLTALTLPVPA